MTQKTNWLYLVAGVLFFLFLGGFVSLIGFALGYLKKKITSALAVGVVLGLFEVAVSVVLNPFGFLFGFLLGENPFGQFVLNIVFAVAFAVIGWFLGSRAKGGRGR